MEATKIALVVIVVMAVGRTLAAKMVNKPIGQALGFILG